MIPAVNPSRLKLTALAALMLLAGSACTKPVPSAPSAPIWQPRPEACHDGFTNFLSAPTYDEKTCEERHTYQTVHVADFEGDLAGRSAPPESIVDAPEAWAVCDKKLTAFLGGEWRDRNIWLRIAMPTEKAWAQGARWFSCEVATANFGAQVTSISRSFSGAYTTMPELEWGCAEATEGLAATKRCDEPHNAEYVGYFVVDMSYEVFVSETGEHGKITRECRSMIGDFVAMPTKRIGYWPMSFGEDEWNKGDHAVRCFLWLDVYVSKSLKGVGASGWPLK
ncbi:MAG TPA: hypothetical protein DGG94_06820 [Micromonosporaceae bacterium]|nr:hypothetical protein [Micromonosporaceae bacterium]HCU49500.1 hypothetical protein [Micromonosporaceae bacterium]